MKSLSTMTSGSRLCAIALAAWSLGACVPETFGSTPYVHNLTRGGITVQVRMVEGLLTCELLAEHAGSFTEDAYGPARRFDLQPGQVLPVLDPSLTVADHRCGAAHVRVGDDFSGVIFWQSADLLGVPEFPSRDADVNDQALQVEGGPGHLFVHAGAALGSVELPERAPPPSCDAAVAPPIAWSGLTSGEVQLLDVRRGVDGCLTLEHTRGVSFLCIPAALFPFTPGDRILFSAPPEVQQDASFDDVREARGLTIESGGRALVLHRDLPRWPIPTASGATLGDGLLEPAACRAQRDGCGSYFVPARLGLDQRQAEAGDVLTEVFTGDDVVDVYVGRVEQVVLTAPDCGAPGSDGTRIDLAYVGSAPPTRPLPDQEDDAGLDPPNDDDGGIDTGDSP